MKNLKLVFKEIESSFLEKVLCENVVLHGFCKQSIIDKKREFINSNLLPIGFSNDKKLEVLYELKSKEYERNNLVVNQHYNITCLIKYTDENYFTKFEDVLKNERRISMSRSVFGLQSYNSWLIDKGFYHNEDTYVEIDLSVRI